MSYTRNKKLFALILMFCIVMVAFIGVSRDSHSKIFAENIAEWKASQDYKAGDEVTYNGDSFYALKDHTSHETNSPGINEGGDYWEYFDDEHPEGDEPQGDNHKVTQQRDIAVLFFCFLNLTMAENLML